MELEKVVEALERKGYRAALFPTGAAAADYLAKRIRGKTVGFGDSQTLEALGIRERLEKHNQVRDPSLAESNAAFLEAAAGCLGTQVFLSSVNALTEAGELVNIDGTGNRVAGTLFGHQKVYFVVGKNKLEPTLEKAVWRARNMAAPQNARRIGAKTPCAVKADKCYDCKSPERICNGLMVYLRKMNDIEMEVLLVDEALGL